MKTIHLSYELNNWEYEILQEYGYDYIKNAQDQAKHIALQLAYEENKKDKEE